MSDTTPAPSTPKPTPTPAKDKGNAQISATIPAELRDAVDAQADSEDRTIAIVVRRALSFYLENHDPDGQRKGG